MGNLKKTNKIMPATIIVTLAVFILVIIIILSSGSETHISEKHEQNAASVLDCTIVSPAKPFFNHNSEIRSEHQVKVKYSDDSINSFNFTYTGTYQSAEIANEALSWLHADYNKYIAQTGVYQEDLFPTFSVIESEAVINLYLPNKYLNSGTAKFIFIDNNEFTTINDMNIQDMRKLYEDKGFSCNTTNN